MGKVFRALFLLVLAVFLVVVSFASLINPDLGKGTSVKTVQKKLNQIDPSGVVVASDNNVTKVNTDINSLPLKDNPEVYQYDDPASVVTMYITVRRGNDLENTNHSWKEVNDTSKFFFQNMEHVVVPKAEVILQIGDENGPVSGELGYGELATNATIQIRGSSTSLGEQKSYKIELFKNAGAWRGQRTIALNKHINDVTRVRNKLSFDLMKTIPNMVSLRTQFVHLYVKDETIDPPGQAYQDYGLFTQVEIPNQTYLKSHLLDRYGQLYKAIQFEFFRYPNNIRLADDPLYNDQDFEDILEIKGNRDHSKLIQMLDDVNNWAIPINQTFEKYFNEDNYFTWLAFNILVTNIDTSSQNFYLYSPQNGQKWYFLPWDYDGTLMRAERQNFTSFPLSPREQGIANYWGAVLHRRVLQVPEYRAKLDQKIQELRQIITADRIRSMLAVYRPITEKYASQMPDVANLPGDLNEFDQVYKMIPDEIEQNYQLYLKTLESPMPFYLGTPEKVNEDTLRFNWDEAYDFNAEDITYRFEISKNWDFTEDVTDITQKNINQLTIPKLEPGNYFWRVTATNERGNSQVAFDFYIDSRALRHDGLKYLYISPDGQIIEKQREVLP